MSHPSPATIYRVGAVAGCGSAVILLINAAKRAEVISTSPSPSSLVRSPRSWLGVALTAASVSFLLGTLAYVTTMLRTGEVPTAPLFLYAVGAIPVALRAFVPEAALDLGLVTMAAGIGWLAIWLFHRSSHIHTGQDSVMSDHHPSLTG